jgi:predicted acyltransferase
MKPRLDSIDIFRGVTITLMILANTGFGDAFRSLPLNESAWNGLALFDLVFPFFLFIVGISIVFSTRSTKKVILRVIILFLIGLVLNGFPFYNLTTLRIMGVLQRIAICYLVAYLVYFHLKPKNQVFLVLGILAIYPLVSGYGPSLDKLVLGVPHLYRADYDPEGFLSTVSALGTVLMGMLLGEYLLKFTHMIKTHRIRTTFLLGSLCIALGIIWNTWLPTNKSLWTSSFSILVSGIATILFSLVYYVVDVKQHTTKGLNFFKVLSRNSILVYCLSAIVSLSLVRWTSLSTTFYPWFLVALTFGICFGTAAILYWRKIFIKV